MKGSPVANGGLCLLLWFGYILIFVFEISLTGYNLFVYFSSERIFVCLVLEVYKEINIIRLKKRHINRSILKRQIPYRVYAYKSAKWISAHASVFQVGGSSPTAAGNPNCFPEAPVSPADCHKRIRLLAQWRERSLIHLTRADMTLIFTPLAPGARKIVGRNHPLLSRDSSLALPERQKMGDPRAVSIFWRENK